MASTPDKPAILYEAVNLVDGKRYIGITCRSLRRRKVEHAYDARADRSRSCRFHNAIRKHGITNFQFTALGQAASFADACDAERRLIADTKPEYNVTLGGEGFLGRTVSAEERVKLSERAKGKPNGMLGRKHTQEARSLMKEAAASRPPKSSEDMRAMWLKGNAGRRKAVFCVSDGKRFASATEAAIHYGWNPTVVANAISKQHGKARGFEFQYEVTP